MSAAETKLAKLHCKKCRQQVTLSWHCLHNPVVGYYNVIALHCNSWRREEKYIYFCYLTHQWEAQGLVPVPSVFHGHEVWGSVPAVSLMLGQGRVTWSLLSWQVKVKAISPSPGPAVNACSCPASMFRNHYAYHPIPGTTLCRLPLVAHLILRSPQPGFFVSQGELNVLVE